MSQLDGILLVDKPEGVTSHDVVAVARKCLGTKAVGHCGTLDPFASGLLILLVGQATKVSDYLLNESKTYDTTVLLGLTTDTQDITGSELRRDPTTVPEASITEAVQRLVGEMEVPVPAFSAKKINGKKLYEYAREGLEVELPIKKMSFFDVEIQKLKFPEVSVRMKCSKGSFVRAWASLLGDQLGVGACAKTLRRTESFPWSVERALTLDELRAVTAQPQWTVADLKNSFVPLPEALPHMKAVVVDGKEQRLLSNGQIPHSLSTRLVYELKAATRLGETLGVRVVSASDRALIAILQAIPGQGLKIRRVFHAE